MKKPDLSQRASVVAEPVRRARRVRSALLARALLLLLVALLVAVWAAHRHVVATASPYMREVGAAPTAACILVPGARIHADGTPFAMLEDRLAAARKLFRAGKAPEIVVSGRGGGGLALDEVGAMRRWLEARGVPPEAIRDDPRGLRTIDSIRNCRRALGMQSAIVVSNAFHVPRTVFLARHLELEAYGVAAPALSPYSAAVLWRNRAREVLARVRACADVYLGTG